MTISEPNAESNEGSGVTVPLGEWVDVPAGMLAAPNTGVDAHGVLRVVRDGKLAEMAVWHWRKKGENPCERKGFTPTTVTYLPNGAPWCGSCLDAKIAYEVEKAFGTLRGKNGNA